MACIADRQIKAMLRATLAVNWIQLPSAGKDLYDSRTLHPRAINFCYLFWGKWCKLVCKIIIKTEGIFDPWNITNNIIKCISIERFVSIYDHDVVDFLDVTVVVGFRLWPNNWSKWRTPARIVWSKLAFINSTTSLADSQNQMVVKRLHSKMIFCILFEHLIV